MTKKVALAAVAIAGLAACDEDRLSVLPCSDSPSPFSLEPDRVIIAIGEQATFRRVPRVSQCGVLPDSGPVEWSVTPWTKPGVITFVSTDDSTATVEGMLEGYTYVIAKLTALKASMMAEVEVTLSP